MTNQPDTQLQSIDSATLTPLVRQALGDETAEVTGWDAQQVHGGGQIRSGIYRFSGKGRSQGATVSWSLILKVIRPRSGGDDLSHWGHDDPSHFGYWKREILAYQSGLLDDLPGGLAAPRCFGVVEQPGGECWIWLEDVKEDLGPQWPLAHYGVAVRHLGQFNGAYLTGRPIPSRPWLGEGWLRRYVDRGAESVEQLPSMLQYPLGRRAFQDGQYEAIMDVWHTREAFYRALDRLPQTLCHRDAWRRNLFARRSGGGGYETVAIDWAHTGPGAIGEDLSPLVLATLSLTEDVDFADAGKLDRICFEGYLDGLHDSGWRGDPRVVRLGFTASGVRYSVGGFSVFLRILRDEEAYAHYERAYGSMEALVDRSNERQAFTLGLLAEARELMDTRG